MVSLPERRPFNIEERRPVWEALSSLFLDTDTSLLSTNVAEVLAASPYAISELTEILYDEVYPVCHWNLFAVAGVWSGIDQVWLEQRVMARRTRGGYRRHWHLFADFFVPRLLPWESVVRTVEELRKS
jgi:hypothetical protein